MGATGNPYKLALPGYRYEFPRDDFNHPEFQTEWWYYTGNLHTANGRRFGFELTFFRHGLEDTERTSAGVWDVHDVWIAHFAISDIDGNRFFHTERLNRAGPGIAGADLNQSRVWNGNWQVLWQQNSQRLQAIAEKFSIRLSLRSNKPPVIHGINGVSQKSAGPGHASHYISFTRLLTHGTLVLEEKQFTVDGLAWMDHEFFTHQLESKQIGWDWFSLQFEDGSELMLFRLRRKDGSPDPYSSGTYIDQQGQSRHLTHADFSLVPGKIWTSSSSGAQYPIQWTIRVPSLGIDVNVQTRLPQQELTGQTAYWEGAIEISGTRKGAGYLEMTGYAAPVKLRF
ncbi:MAG TPA: lipocalin-like domain-containing protein [Bryobacteraceae bacterium]|nr:lipocalin-like domain-containing protein [Bryobacteraceae bacterium]